MRKWRRKKPKTKKCLREMKKLWNAWQQISRPGRDTKYLDDIPEYWIQERKTISFPGVTFDS